MDTSLSGDELAVLGQAYNHLCGVGEEMIAPPPPWDSEDRAEYAENLAILDRLVKSRYLSVASSEDGRRRWFITPAGRSAYL